MDIVESHKQVVNTKMENMDDISLVEYRNSAKRQDMFIKKQIIFYSAKLAGER